MHKKRTLSQQDKDYFLSLKPDDIDLNLLHDLFTDTFNRKTKKIQPSKYNTYDEFTLTPKDYFVKSEVLTNCGLFIVNKFLFEQELQDVIGYVNKPIDKKQLGSINGKLVDALLIDQITSDTYINYLNRLTWLAFTFNTEVSTSLSVAVLKENPAVAKEKKRLMEGKYKDALKNNDAAMISQMEAELIAVAEKELADDPAIDLYKSGARGSMDSYKVSQIMKGPVYNESKHQYEIITKGLATGVEKKDVPVLANSMILGQYNKSIAPGESGYLSKKLSAAFQVVVMDKKGTDCGTKMYSTITLTPENLNFYKFNYMVEGNKLVRLDPSNYNKYMGKTVKLRTNNYCLNKNICNACGGDMPYLIGLTNIGLSTPRISNSMLQGRMKQFHNANIKTWEFKDSDFM